MTEAIPQVGEIIPESINVLNLWEELPCFDCEHFTHCHFERNLSKCPKIQAELKVSVENSAIFEVYQRFKHLDMLIIDFGNCSDSPINQALSQMWKAIKSDLMVEVWDSQPVKNASDDKAGDD